jgi:hypothetical protein
VEVAVPVAMREVTIKGLVVEAMPGTVIEEPRETEVPLMVIEEFWRKVLVMEEAGRETVEVAVKAPTVKTPAVVEPKYAFPAPKMVEVAALNVCTAVQVLA